MPIYEYKCQECGKVSEFFFRTSSDSRTFTCPNCGSHNLDKLLSVPSLLKVEADAADTTCCGRTKRCETPPCSSEGKCRRR